MNELESFTRARDFLRNARSDWQKAYEGFQWPRLERFNWAIDYFDFVARENEQPALRIVSDTEAAISISYRQMSQRSSQVANFLRARGLQPGDRILISLGNCVELWETTLAAMKLGVTIIPTTPLSERNDLTDRTERGRVSCVITHSHLAERYEHLRGPITRIAIGEPVSSWVDYDEAANSADLPVRAVATQANETLLLYFTSGTTAKPKLVEHSHVSYPVGHLTTMYWLGLQKGDVHLNLSSPGWAKHAWSNVFAPWSAESCVLAYQYERFDAKKLLMQLTQHAVTTFCAPPTVWRMLVQEDMKLYPVKLREVMSAGEPLNAEIIEQVRDSWGITIRDGYGQTETTAIIANSPGQRVKAGSMGRPLPGYHVVLIDANDNESDEGEVCIDLSNKPVGVMTHYADDREQTDKAFRNGLYHTSDIATRDKDGYLTFVGRTDDVFKSSDYRISPFELESILVEHEAVAEAAVVPSPDPLRLSVPKAFIVLAQGYPATSHTAREIIQHVRDRVSPYKRIRRIEFGALPKTISGKIRRTELRKLESKRVPHCERNPNEYWDADLDL
jgi:acetyl-CoA synthetase